MYLIDDSGKKEYTNLREKGFYNQIIASNAVATMQTDSIKIDQEKNKFTFFGKQFINRKSAIITRKLITEGFYEDIIRSPNNPHGVIIKDWRILNNDQIDEKNKSAY